jgi:hypothetical protein
VNSGKDANPVEQLQWRRDTPWKQGSVVPAETFVTLGIVQGGPESSDILIVISHDCDLAEDDLEIEPFVELLWAQTVPSAEPDFTHAKSPNTLDLEIRFEYGVRALRLKAYSRLTLPKSKLSGVQPDSRFVFDEKSRGILQSWLAARYKRAALPDALYSHLSAIRRTLQEIGKRSPHAIVGFFIDHDPVGETTDPEEPYELWITVVYDHSIPGAEHVAVEAAQKIRTRLERKFKTDKGWTSIDLRYCEACSDREFSLYDAQTLKLYRLEHISLRHSARSAY